jgi:hypothetical protein
LKKARLVSIQFNPRAYQVKNRLQSSAFKCNLYRYAREGQKVRNDLKLQIAELMKQITVGLCTLNQVDP